MKPTIENICDDEAMGVRFVVLAYRKLTRREVLSTIRMALASARKRPKKGAIVTIHTVID